jgi:aarF domain-containing kinase
MLSTRKDVLPKQITEKLKSCQDQMPSATMAIIRATVESEIGRPLEEVFTDFNEQCLACASIAQVHRAKLKSDGSDVIVKVQHKNIARLLKLDIRNISNLAGLQKRLEPSFSLKPIFDAWSAEVPMELDFVHELNNTLEVYDSWKRDFDDDTTSPFHIDVMFPTMNRELTSQKVLVATFCPVVALHN